MEEDRHRRLPRVHNAYAHVCKSFQVAIERSKSTLVHLWQVLPYIIASLWFAVAFILSCRNAIVLLTPMLFVQLLGCCISCCIFVGLCCYFRCWFQSGFIALVGHMSLLCFAVESDSVMYLYFRSWTTVGSCRIFQASSLLIGLVESIDQTSLCIRRRRFTNYSFSCSNIIIRSWFEYKQTWSRMHIVTFAISK